MRNLFLPLVLLLLSACLMTPENAPFAPYSPKAPSIALDVASVEVVEAYQSSGAAPYVEHSFPITPADAVKTWVKKRLKTTGQSRRLEVTIKDASAKAEKLPLKDGIEGLLTNEADTRVNARIEVEMRLYSDKTMSDASVNVVALRSQTFSESTPLAERDRLLYDLVLTMMDDLDRSLEKNIRENFGKAVMTR